MAVKKGRPRIKFDLGAVEKLGMLQCTDQEIGDFFGVSIDTIRDRMKDQAFSNALLKGKSMGKRSLRRSQWQKAQAGSVPMLIWLGKQWLGQRDKIEHSGDEEHPVVVRVLKGVSMEDL